MPNPLEKLVALAKSGDRRVLIGGAVVVGGGAGLFVYLRRKQGGGVTAMPTPSVAPGGEGGGGGGGGSSDLSGLGDLGSSLSDSGLPTLSDPFASTTPLLDTSFEPSSLAGGLDMPTLPELAGSLLPTASPYSGAGYGALPTLGPESYAGAAYGNDIGALPTAVGGSGGGATETNVPAANAPLSRAENIAALVHSPVTAQTTSLDAGFAHTPIGTGVTPANAAVVHAPISDAGRQALQQATAQNIAALQHTAIDAQRQAAQQITAQNAALQHAAEEQSRQAAQQLADYQSRVQAQIQSSIAAAQHQAELQRQAAFSNYQATVAALLHQQQAGFQRSAYTLASSPGGQSFMVAPRDQSQLATAALVHNTQTQEAARMAASIVPSAAVVHTATPAPVVHAPVSGQQLRS